MSRDVPDRCILASTMKFLSYEPAKPAPPSNSSRGHPTRLQSVIQNGYPMLEARRPKTIPKITTFSKHLYGSLDIATSIPRAPCVFCTRGCSLTLSKFSTTALELDLSNLEGRPSAKRARIDQSDSGTGISLESRTHLLIMRLM